MIVASVSFIKDINVVSSVLSGVLNVCIDIIHRDNQLA